MTNRRRSGKGRTSVSKKTESPEKQSKKLTRRSRRGKVSDSPERPEEPDSDYSANEHEEEEGKKYDGENENYKDVTLEPMKNDDQRSSLKEEESGGSDGSWKVKSENGGGGGIPKLKLCLTRPPEMASPTPVDQHPSPRRRRRGTRGTPTKEEDHTEVSAVEECPKRITRNQKAKSLAEPEAVSEEKHQSTSAPPVSSTPELQPLEDQPHSKPDPEPQIDHAPQTGEPGTKQLCNSRYNDDDETRIAVESISVLEPTQGNETSGPTEDTDTQPPPKDNAESPQLSYKQLIQVSQSSDSPVKNQDPQIALQHSDESEPKQQNHHPASAAAEAPSDPEPVSKPEPEPELEPEPSPEPELTPVHDKRRSSSRDSSEERAKEEALRSRNKNRKKEDATAQQGKTTIILTPQSLGSEEGAEQTSESTTEKSETKENAEETAPTKSGGARKRRWGSSTNSTSKKQSVSISTDFLKEIIPEAKPLLMSEVQLSPNEEDEEGQIKDSEESLPVAGRKADREKLVQSEESEKDYEEEVGESLADETTQSETAKPLPPVKEKEYSTTFTRKVSVLSSNERLQKSPSPPKQKPSNIIYIVNLVRPFTIPQLRELLARTGTIVEDGFWIDKIKSKCYVKYETEEEAKTTRHALHGVRWPVSNPKQLIVDFGTEAAMKAAMEGNELVTKRPIPSLFEKQIDLKTSDLGREKDKGPDKRDRNDKEKLEKGRSKGRENEKREEGEDDKDKKRPPVEAPARDRTVRRVTMPVREWDVGKNEDGFSPPPEGAEFSRHRDDRYERRVEYDRNRRDDYDERRRRDKDRNRRSVSEEPPRKSKKKNEEEAPAKLLDDLFRKTKATPCIYWLPLTPEQISVKEEMRRKHMAEHEKKVAELRKIQREQSKRSSDKRRRRTKSRSRSRSVKK